MLTHRLTNASVENCYCPISQSYKDSSFHMPVNKNKTRLIDCSLSPHQNSEVSRKDLADPCAPQTETFWDKFCPDCSWPHQHCPRPSLTQTLNPPIDTLRLLSLYFAHTVFLIVHTGNFCTFLGQYLAHSCTNIHTNRHIFSYIFFMFFTVNF